MVLNQTNMDYLKELNSEQKKVYKKLVAELFKAGDTEASANAFAQVMAMSDEEIDQIVRDMEAPSGAGQPRYKVYATKLDRDEGAVFERICEKQGSTPYGKIQELVSAYIRLCDPGCVLSEHLRQMIMLFEINTKSTNRLQLADPSAEASIREATYFMGDQRKKGMRLVHVYEPFLGEAIRTENAQEILERTVQELFPTLYQKIREAGAEIGATNLLDILTRLADEKSDMRDANEIERTFSDVRKDERGREMASAPYRRTMTNSMESYEQKLRRFEQRQTSLDLD